MRIPRVGHVVQCDGSTTIIDQSRVPECVLARVTGRESQRAPDVVGVSSLFNAAPIGKGNWRVKILGALPANDNTSDLTSDLEDLHIDLHLAFRRCWTSSMEE